MLAVVNHKKKSVFRDVEGNRYEFNSIAAALEFSERFHQNKVAAIFAYHFATRKKCKIIEYKKGD